MPVAFLLHRERPKPQGGGARGGWRCFSEAIFNRAVIIYCLKNMNRRLSAVALSPLSSSDGKSQTQSIHVLA